MRTVAVLALDGVVPVDLAIPVGVFGHARLADGKRGYEVKVCGPGRSVDAGLFRIHLEHSLSALRRVDTIVIAGIDTVERVVPPAVLSELRRAAARGARIASICSGAFVFAQSGLLDGKRATTHWIGAQELARRHPSIRVDASVLYVDDGQFLTSAGAIAGLDLCLHMVRNDYGAAVAASSARLAVMPLERSGGQAQFIVHEPPTAANGDSLSDTLEWMERNLKKDLSVDAIAKRAAMSSRTLARKFLAQTGTTPAHWVARARVTRAQALLETTPLSVEGVADAVGFGSAISLRARFKDIVGVSPLDYRRSFRSRAVKQRRRER